MNNYIRRNSIIHKTNPLIKLIPFIMIVVLVFLRTDLLTQVIIFVMVLSLWFLAKIPVIKLKQLMITYVVMFSLLFFINFLAEKNPIYISDSAIASSSIKWGDNYNNNTGYVHTGGGFGIKVVTDHCNPYWAKLFTHGQAPVGGNSGCSSSSVTTQAASAVTTTSSGGTKSIMDELKEWIQKGANGVSSRSSSSTPVHNFNYHGFSLDNLRYELVGNGQYIGYFVKWYSISNYAWLSSLYISNKLLIVILASTIFSSTTSTVELTYSFEDLLRPLRYIRFPANELAMILSIAIRFIPSLISESMWILNSQASRGIDFKNGSIREKISSLTSLIVPLFTISFLKADDLANAMTARSYNPRYPRSRFRIFSLHSSDILGFMLVTFIICLLFYGASQKFIFGPFGFYNVLIVLGR